MRSIGHDEEVDLIELMELAEFLAGQAALCGNGNRNVSRATPVLAGDWLA